MTLRSSSGIESRGSQPTKEPLAQIPGTCELCGQPDDGGDIQQSMTDPGNWTHTRCLMAEEF